MIGQTLGHYRIVEKIGAGGMGEVYRAHDERLDRDVALKVLPAGTLADESARKRFRKEALALSKLNHPNVETVHDFDTQEGVDFLVMEHIPGITLSDKLAAGPVPEKEITRLGAQLAEGLTAAHEQGVVHRDLKPGNLRVTPDGRLKILDFGLAKLLRPVSATATTESLTETQAVAGTVPYMAPEQLQGEPVDARTDLYAVGTVLYEMATGRRPFEQKLASALIADIVHTPPPRPSQFNPRVASRLEEIILKCLEKEPENRYQSSKELGVDLRRLATPSAAVPAARGRRLGRRYALVGAGLGVGVLLAAILVGLNVGGLRERLLGQPGPPKIESLAVLPLENFSGDPGQEYFADGMTEELISQLAQIEALRVTSRTSVMPYKEKKKPLKEIARELKVDWVVEGSVRRVGDRVRVTAQLIDARTDKHLWAQNYDRNLKDVMVLQSDVARAIAAEINVRLSPQEKALLARARPVNPAAHEAYLRGVTEENLAKSLQYFQQAIQLDPTYAPAHAGSARVYYFLGLFGVLPSQQAFGKMREEAQKALELDETLADAHGWLALVKLHYDWDWAGAEREFQRALALNPSQADVHHDYAHFLMAMNRQQEWVTESERAVELNPFDPGLNTCLAWHHLYAREYDKAIAQSQKVLQAEPDYWWARINLAWAYEQKGMYSEAIAQFQKSLKLWPGSSLALAGLGHTYALAGKKPQAAKVLAQLHENAKKGFVPAYDLATVYAGLGDAEQAFFWLDKAYQERSAFLVHVKWDPKFQALRSDPRFQDLLQRMNFPP